MSTQHFDQENLARRWRVSPRTLERWRWCGEGPRFVKVGRRVVYTLDDVLQYEAQRVRTRTGGTGSTC